MPKKCRIYEVTYVVGEGTEAARVGDRKLLDVVIVGDEHVHHNPDYIGKGSLVFEDEAMDPDEAARYAAAQALDPSTFAQRMADAAAVDDDDEQIRLVSQVLTQVGFGEGLGSWRLAGTVVTVAPGRVAARG